MLECECLRSCQPYQPCQTKILKIKNTFISIIFYNAFKYICTVESRNILEYDFIAIWFKIYLKIK